MEKINLKQIKSSLPETPGIMWSRHYRKASILVPLIKVKDEFHLLFEVRSKNIKQGTEVCFPGGRFDSEKDADFQDTAVRETIEELGIDEDKIEILGQFNTLVHHMGMLIYTFIGILHIDSTSKLSLDEKEVSSVFTLPIEHFRKNGPEEYTLRLEAKPEIIDNKGGKVTLLPVKKLGLPEKYTLPWGSNNHKVIVYKSTYPVIWGMTAKIVSEFIGSLS
ncbi:MAG: CoA pyrophosphatase [Victivallales bacterium]|nr:CoA pyrophosphatase [Victivallales bacterium]MCF7889151.1 CoA pyrophosphatase [Victivallales bacterium]